MRFKIAGKALGLLFLVYTFLRFLFLLLNQKSFQKFDFLEIARSFAAGLRFDVSALLILNLPFLFFIFLAPRPLWRTKIFQRSLHGFFVLINFPFIAANLIDAEYFKFTGNRMNIEIFFFRKEAGNQVQQFLVNYWYLGLVGAGLFLVLIRFFPKKPPQFPPIQNIPVYLLKTMALAVVTSIVLLFGIRGGFQPKPIQPIHAHSMGGSSELGILTLNSTFTLLKSKLGTHRLSPVNYFPSAHQVLNELKQGPLSLPPPQAAQNVVIIVLESFATEFWGAANTYKGYTPFLDGLAKEGLFFKNNYANGRRSIDALPAIFFGVPCFMTTPVVKTNYQANQWNGLGHIAKRAGRHVSFFHGAPQGTMYFDAISAMAGFDDYYPFERYPNTTDFDGHWGIFDEPFLQFMVQKLNTHSQPFLSTVFTISTHQPYHVPPQYEGVFPKGTMQIHQSIGYVDHALKRFFEEAAKQPWYKNTLFVITGDHTQMSDSEHYNNEIGRYRVPLLFYHPSQKLTQVDPNRVTQHTDILPSVLDFLGIRSEPYLLFGRSVFDKTQKGESIFSLFGIYWLVRDKYFLRFNENDQTSQLFAIDDPSQSQPLSHHAELKNEMELRVKSYIQYYKNSMIQNNLYAWHPSVTNPPRKPAEHTP